ncbi:alpha/beta hydrolase [Herbiconiux sp. CPCC 203407]|uniref:Alpha/beta hydrolase n=1 Tax=Herbiconiux oxytropis TaxID=2970915 RepID=A0AA41XEH1_9MICO|nr:alpha/beta hydrolase [Herbiconiux oxytropis]MCS5721682.1 alpha/beta hydrolase [Herbiconiux oxytropis]MCS5726691.1 alpha/beta hydrolase [Herbiconiux oxytropis]
MSTSDAVELSPEALAFENLLQSGGAPSELDIRRNATENLHQAASEPEGVTYREVNANGVFGIWAEPLGANTDFVLLHAHAGGSVVTSAFVDRKLAGHIAKAVGIPILVVDFRRAPEHKYPAQVDDVEAAFDWLIEQGYPPEKIVTIGHSIGGFLALAVALRRRDAGKSLPGAIVSISPWADLGIANETIESNASTDKVLSRGLLEFFREAWIGGTDTQVDDLKINLNSSDLSGLPPTLVSWGTYEVLAGEDEELAERLEAAGVSVEALPVAGAQHSYVWAAGRVPETDRAIQQIATWVRTTLAL